MACASLRIATTRSPPRLPPDRKEPIRAVQVPRRKTPLQPRMSADDRREAIATARRLQARGRTPCEIAEALGVLPEFVEGWLRELPTTK